MSSKNKDDLNLNKQKNISSCESLDVKSFFENNSKISNTQNNKNNNSDSDYDKFGDYSYQKNDDEKEKNKIREEVESSDEESYENYELNIVEEDSSLGKKIEKKRDKNKEKMKARKKVKKKKMSDLSEDNEKMSMDYSSSDYFIKQKYPKKKKNQNKNQNTSFSRFKQDFIIIKKLGQGGEGTVFEVKNKFDQQSYAIKRMKIRSNEVSDSVKNEVYFLSRNRCPYIVRYYQTWTEDYNKDDFKDESDFEDSEESSTIQRKSSFEEKSKTTLQKENSKLCYASDGIVDDSSSDEEEEENKEDDDEDDYAPYAGKGLGIWDDNESEEENNKNKKKKKSKFNNKNKKQFNKKKNKEKLKILYIQMELCENNTLRDAIDKGQLDSDELKWRLISQILEGVKYIHENGYIHRDLKPGNIFLDERKDVKIGDFGLVQNDKTKKGVKNNTIMTFFNYTNSLQYINFGGELMTVGIGTKYYCSPEQEKSDNYDNKTDIYSLGIIIFEMFYKFSSLMERDYTLRKINSEQVYPDDMEEKCGKNVMLLVKKCTYNEPKLRPTIKDLMKSKLIPPSIQTKQIIIKQFNEQFLEKNIKLINDFLFNLIEKKKEQTINNMKSSIDFTKTVILTTSFYCFFIPTYKIFKHFKKNII